MQFCNDVKIILVLFGFVSVNFIGITPSDAASFQGLGDLSGGGFESHAHAVSAAGSVVVGYSKSTNGPEAFYWTESGGMKGLGFLPDTPMSKARGVSHDGALVVGYCSPAAYCYHAFLCAGPESEMQDLGEPPEPYVYSAAYGTSADGSVVVGRMSWFESYPHVWVREAFRWTQAEGMKGLGDLPGGSFYSIALDVSADGSVVVGYSNTDWGDRAFRWTASEGIQDIGCLPGNGTSRAWAVSADGSVVVGISGNQAFRWTSSEGIQGLGYLPDGGNSEAWDVSDDGLVIVGKGTTDLGDEEAFIWYANHSMWNLKDLLENDFELDLTGWTLTRAEGISADGSTIVGFGTNPDGNKEGWIATCEPPYCSEPIPGDVDGNCKIDIFDLAILAFHWHEDNPDLDPIPGDINGDDKVNLLDFAILASNWLECNLTPEMACWN
ncbi:MAG: hypothetical protein KAS23_16045 [Anaerohalosphaera sp.]|nr:hypothetical protein [Anaerohalosphaera sp.]